MEKIKLDLVKILTKELKEIFEPNLNRNMKSSLKSDQSIVTEIDLMVSDFLKDHFLDHPQYKNYSYFSEEDASTFKFPCAIVDPIDGTRELAKGRGECVVSVALMNSSLIADELNYAWLYNPFSGFDISSLSSFVHAVDFSEYRISGMASRSEFHRGFFDQLTNPKIQVIPRGSIAFKLGLLASGACDFVVSKNPKNVWDIAAGTIIAGKRGFNFYENGKKITHLDREHYSGTLIWANDFHIEALLKEFQK